MSKTTLAKTFYEFLQKLPRSSTASASSTLAPMLEVGEYTDEFLLILQSIRKAAIHLRRLNAASDQPDEVKAAYDAAIGAIAVGFGVQHLSSNFNSHCQNFFPLDRVNMMLLLHGVLEKTHAFNAPTAEQTRQLVEQIESAKLSIAQQEDLADLQEFLLDCLNSLVAASRAIDKVGLIALHDMWGYVYGRAFLRLEILGKPSERTSNAKKSVGLLVTVLFTAAGVLHQCAEYGQSIEWYGEKVRKLASYADGEVPKSEIRVETTASDKLSEEARTVPEARPN